MPFLRCAAVAAAISMQVGMPAATAANHSNLADHAEDCFVPIHSLPTDSVAFLQIGIDSGSAPWPGSSMGIIEDTWVSGGIRVSTSRNEGGSAVHYGYGSAAESSTDITEESASPRMADDRHNDIPILRQGDAPPDPGARPVQPPPRPTPPPDATFVPYGPVVFPGQQGDAPAPPIFPNGTVERTSLENFTRNFSGPEFPDPGPDEDGPCGFTVYSGSIAMIYNQATGALAIDLTDAMGESGRATVMVTAISVNGAYVDGHGYWTQVGYPLENYQTTVFEFRLSGDKKKIDVFKPVMDVKTTDDESKLAVRRGVGSGWMDVLPRMLTPLCYSFTPKKGEGFTSAYDDDRIVVDASTLIRRGFFVAEKSIRRAPMYEVDERTLAAHPRNIDVTVEYLVESTNPSSPLKIGFSMIVLPPVPMTARANDDRLLYFSTDYSDLGFRQNGPEKLPSDMVNSQRSMIWRYNLNSSMRRGHIRLYVDPTVPKRWREWFRRGIEAWNDGFADAGHPGAVKAVLPGEHDWPSDYNIADIRFSTLSWSISDAVVSMGVAKVDPRSGEILKSDVIMSDGWVKSWLKELDHLAPNLTHQLEPEPAPLMEQAAAAPQSPHAWLVHPPGKGDSTLGFNLLSQAAGGPLSDQEQEDLLGAGIQDVIMHEVGHILGLRHNFKGSLGVSYNCTRNASCTAEKGLTASVMDYVPMNLPTVDGPDVLPFSPVIGEYDRLAIKYGYMETAPTPWPQVAPELQEVLGQAEAFGACYDADDSVKQDPGCAKYDLSDDPLQYYEDLLRTYAEAQRNLLNMSVVLGEPYVLYGRAVDWMLKKTQSVGESLVAWFGGINSTHAHRGFDGSTAEYTARRPVCPTMQRRAMDLFLTILRPQEAELLPPGSNLPYLVRGDSGEGFVYSYDLDARIRSMTTELLLLALNLARVLQVFEQEGILDEADAAAAETPLGVAEYLGKLVSGVIGDGLDVSYPAEWELQSQLVETLKGIYFANGVPEEVQSNVMYQLQVVSDAAEAAYLRAKDPAETSSGWRFCAAEGKNCTCNGLVRFGSGSRWTAAVSLPTTNMKCSAKVFGNPGGGSKECQCLNSVPESSDLLHSHLRLMRKSLAQVFCRDDASCLYPRVPSADTFVQTAENSAYSPLRNAWFWASIANVLAFVCIDV